jgi:tRNA G18 (ribose-2'-O)-methylase SpoU
MATPPPSVPSVIKIDDPDDPRIADYRAIRERDRIGRRGLFIAEGEVVLRVLLGPSRHKAASLLVAEKRIPSLAPMLETLPPTVPIYAANQAVMDCIAGFSIHRGILALGRIAQMPTADHLLGSLAPRALVVVLFGTANHDNMGGIFRNVAAFGADAVILDNICCDPLYRKAIRVSVGAALIVPFARLDRQDDPIRLLTAHGYEPVALSPSGSSRLADLRRSRRMAILLGSEGQGLPKDLIAGIPSVRIPMAAGFDSLNVATATGIVLHHLTSQ